MNSHIIVVLNYSVRIQLLIVFLIHSLKCFPDTNLGYRTADGHGSVCEQGASILVDVSVT